MNEDIARRAFHLFALAGKVVQLPAVYLDRRVHGRELLLRALKMRKPRPHRRKRRIFAGYLGCFAGSILRIGCVAKRKARDIFFVLRGRKIGRLGRPADKHRQHAGRHRVKRAAVANPAGAQDAAQLGHHVMRSKALRLIHQQNAV